VDQNTFELLQVILPLIAALAVPFLTALAKYVFEPPTPAGPNNAGAGDGASKPRGRFGRALLSRTTAAVTAIAILMSLVAVVALSDEGVRRDVRAWFDTTPRINVMQVYKPFLKKSDIPPIMPVLQPIKIEGNTHAVSGRNLNAWVILCGFRDAQCMLKRLQLYDGGDWEDTIQVGQGAQTCDRFKVLFVVVDGDGDKTLAPVSPGPVADSVVESVHKRDADVFIIQLVEDEQQEC
jgi:hypothetical protein